MADQPDGKNSEPSAAELADTFGRVAKVLAREFDERLAEVGVSFPRARVLVEVARLGPIRVTDVAAAVGIAQGTASSLLDALVRDGLVERVQDSADRRVTKMVATPEGEQQSETWLQAYQAAAEELFAPLPRSRRAELLAIMAELDAR
ncbi:MarR family winged helix-turn-helix transcriptional regulator [Myceligenerans pegani]|uniref:Winged helix-turn-helix transcriptional regulator n=1 Tax=Myceligenerans pegani TaxID=2776917 RepID=A0ABR9N3M2_9MICO|nr:MarR family winged helix-turn-helix transcriptional regulator [Myceligenerans sp. TRM 65318]MBE1878249.1 winged helix-turn-helix transcriptional regulator [Myceligenerans sp. TRM 65318]MBE3020520.1 winged helix-turn-helix transcriptional regulator [Myceligenerans sp. TRM 65318]